MKNFVVYKKSGKILRAGICLEKDFFLQARDNESVMEGVANDVTQKIVGGRIVDKTPEEIEKDDPTPPEMPESQRPAYVTNERWQGVLDRLDKLEKRTAKNDE